MNKLETLLNEKGVLLADGATGTTLFSMGLTSGDSPELWNDEHPDRIEKLHQLFVDAGSDLFLTNSFGGNRYRLKLHNAEHRVAELNEKAARIGRKVADKADRPVIVAGSIGPTGEIFAPIGELQFDDAVAAFKEQAEALAAGGVDVLWLETISSAEEFKAGVIGAASTGLPVAATLSFDTNGSTMMGITPPQLSQMVKELDTPLAAIGTNCGVGASEVVSAMMEFTNAGQNPPLVAKANCGIPEFVDGKVHYNGTPELMGKYAEIARNAGASIIGGCCGTTATHIAAMREQLDNTEKADAPTLEEVQSLLGEISSGALNRHQGIDAPAPRKSNRRRRRS